MAYFTVVALCFVISSLSVDAAPMSRQFSHEGNVNDYAKDWLKKYGYLRDSPDVTLFESTLALMNMQHFHKLPVTGVFGEEEGNLMQRDRCGFPDMVEDETNKMLLEGRGESDISSLERFRRYSVNRNSKVWPSNNINYRFLDYTSDLPRAVQEEAVRKAAGKWSAASALSISKSSTYSADMEISFRRLRHGDNYDFDGPSGVLAHAFSPGNDLGGDIHFDDDETFTVNSAYGSDFTYITLHEMGHSLGLEHSSNQNAIMSTFFTNNPTDIQLHDDDIAGIQSLYGAPQGGQSVDGVLVAPPVSEEACETVYNEIADVGVTYFFFHEGRIVQSNHEFSPVNQPLSLDFVFRAGPSRVDAAYVSDNVMVTLFQGSTYWRYNFQTLELDPSTPSSIFDFGISVTSVDTVFYRNGEVYLFKDSYYWRYSTSTGTTQGPTLIQSTWSDVTASATTPLDSVFYKQSGDLLFFVIGNTFWNYDSQNILQDDGNFNSQYTQELCKWCEVGGENMVVPKILMTIIGVIMAYVMRY